MSENNNRAQELLAQEGLESIAQKLYNKIYIDLPGEPNAPRRWIWELLQNAKDVIDSDGKVEINLTENCLEFSHNGAPFLHENLLALLSQNSTKKHSYTDDEKSDFFFRLCNEESITKEEANNFLNISGRFGTGFMTTYLLSKTVHLEGIYANSANHRPFKLSFDRNVERDFELKQKVKDSFSSFIELENPYHADKIIQDYKSGVLCDTKFIYEFDVSGRDIAKQGIADLHSAIPFVLSFVEKLKSIKISELGIITTYTHSTELRDGVFSIEKIEKNTEKAEEDRVFYLAKLSEKYDFLSIAVPIEKISPEKFKIIFPDEGTPRQFVSFPLVGSETFPFPVIINSPLFNPNDSRSHVYLDIINSEDFDKKVKLNRLLFERAVNLYKGLLNNASKRDWEDINILAKSDLPKNLTDDWFKDSIQHEIRKEILEADIVVTDYGGKIKPKDALFPIYEKYKMDTFWELCMHLNKDKLPRKKDAEVWKTIIAANSDKWLGNDFGLTLEKLLRQIESELTFKNFNSRYFQGDESMAFRALNEIIQFAESEDNDLINDKDEAIAIFPNQTLESNFTYKKCLSRDAGIPNQIKEVLRVLGENWYKELVRNEITVFERDSRLTVKEASNKIRELIELWMIGTLPDDDFLHVEEGLLILSSYCSEETEEEIININKYLNEYFPKKTKETVEVLMQVEDFNWNPIKMWAVTQIFQKVSSFSCLENFSIHLFDKSYPSLKEDYTDEETELMFKVDTKINDLIQFALKFDKTLLEKFPIIPNQLNQFCLFNKDISNDDNLLPELKKIMAEFGHDCRLSLLHKGVSVDLLGDNRDLKWICGELDDIAIKEQENPELKQPIRELDKWISKQKGIIPRLDELFKSFYRRRYGIVLNTYDIKERDQFDSILKSGMIDDFAEILYTGASIESIRSISTIFRINPTLTAQKIERLLELEELSKGWDPALTYTPDKEHIRKNFENGWKGEAFVFKELKKLGLNVEWKNQTKDVNDNKIVDYENDIFYISDKGDKYDLFAINKSGKRIFIQVKATTTSISDADQISLPISTREWNFVFETNEDDYYLARVFNVNEHPSVYYMKLQPQQRLS